MNARLPIACVVAVAAGCGGLLIINQPDGGEPPCCDGGLPDGGSTENGPPDRTRTTLLVLPDTTAVADGTTALTVRVIVRDAAGHLLRGVGVAMSCDGTANAFNPASGAGYTGTDGTFQAALTSTVAEPKTVTVTVNTFTLTAGVTFTAGRPDPSNSSLALAPPSLTADGVQTAAITASLRDAYSNIVAGYTVSFTATGSNNLFNPTGGATSTDSSGVARIRLASTRAEPKTVVATVGSLFVMTRQVTFGPGAAAQATSSMTAVPTALVAGGTTTLTVLARDAYGNTVPSMPVTFGASGSDNNFSPSASASTNVDGVARVTLTSSVAETKTVSAQAAGLNFSTLVRFGAGSPTNGNSSLAVQTPVVADGAASGLITVSVRDGSNNPTPGQSVSLVASGSLNTFSPSSSGTTDANGLFTARLSSTVAETKAVTANLATFSLTNFMDFIAGPPNAANSQMSATPSNVMANGVATTALAAVFRDANGNPVPGLPVTLSSTGSANVFSATSGNTGADGAFSATLKSTKAELKTVSVTAGGVTLQTSVSFNPGPPSAATSSVSASPNNVVANGFSYTTLTTTILDALSNPVPNLQVVLSVTGSSNFFGNTSGITGSGGVFQTWMSSYTAETKTVTMTVTGGGIAPTTTVTFIPGPPNSYGSTVQVAPSQVKADGVASATVTVTVRDTYYNIVPGVPVSLFTPHPADRYVPSSAGTANASGVFTAQISSTTTGYETLTASANGSSIGSAGIEFVP